MAKSDIREAADLLQEKLTRLRKAWAIEDNPAVKHKYETQIEEAKQDLAKLELTLNAPGPIQRPETPQLKRYANHLIEHTRWLPQQGIHAGGKPVNIELEQIFVTLRSRRERTVLADDRHLAEAAKRMPGERELMEDAVHTESVIAPVPEILAERRRLAVLGDPGSGKTTLLHYLTLVYAKDLLPDKDAPVDNIRQKLDLDEAGYLPILLYLRQVGNYLQDRYPDDDTFDGHGVLLDLLTQTLYKSHRVKVDETFFDAALEEGRAIVLLDGLDEVADPAIQRRVVRLVECLVRAYPKARYIVTCRILSYKDDARLGEQFDIATIQDFSRADIEQFLTHWYRQIALSLMDDAASAAAHAKSQTEALLADIDANPNIQNLAINPLMLTVIALIQRQGVKLPNRRADLYEVVIKALLETRDEARNIQLPAVLPDGSELRVDMRLNVLQELALTMHREGDKDIEKADLRDFLKRWINEQVYDCRATNRDADLFLQVLMERTGLLMARSHSVFCFSHLTFQEYLAGRAVADLDDYRDFILARSGEPWWREVILLATGYLADGGPKRPTRLIRAMADRKDEPAPFHNLILAAECARDVTPERLEPALVRQLKQRLWQALDTPLPTEKEALVHMVNRKAAVTSALSWLGEGHWHMPYGEPEWIEIPAGEFWMGSDDRDDMAYDREKPKHKVKLSAYAIGKTPVTNAQYAIFVKATGRESPKHWSDGQPPKDKTSHPVVYVSWHDAVAYCEWLSKMTGTDIRLPTEAEWERAARGPSPFEGDVLSQTKGGQGDVNRYPWGWEFEAGRCNNADLGLRDTSPVGIFPNGASAEGVLDMSGNVWEWCQDWFSDSYYQDCLQQGTVENPAGPQQGPDRVRRGGGWDFAARRCRAADRGRLVPDRRFGGVGFRLVFVPQAVGSLSGHALEQKS